MRPSETGRCRAVAKEARRSLRWSAKGGNPERRKREKSGRGGALQNPRSQNGPRPRLGLFWRCLHRMAAASVEEPSKAAADGFRVLRVLKVLRLSRRG